MVSALGKLAAQAGRPLTADAAALVEACARAESVELQQRALEVQALLRASAATQRAALPYDAAAEDVGVDPDLPFLDAFVQQVGGRAAWLGFCGGWLGWPGVVSLTQGCVPVDSSCWPLNAGASCWLRHYRRLQRNHTVLPVPLLRCCSRCKAVRRPTCPWRIGWPWG